MYCSLKYECYWYIWGNPCIIEESRPPLYLPPQVPAGSTDDDRAPSTEGTACWPGTYAAENSYGPCARCEDGMYDEVRAARLLC